MLDDRRPRGPVMRGPSPGPGSDRPFDRFNTGPPRGAQQSLRLRDGERELEVSGTAEFIRQTLGDLPSLMARLRGEPAPRGDISMPPSPPARTVEAPAAAPPRRVEPPAPTPAAPASTISDSDLERRILGVLRRSSAPMTVYDIRQRLGDDVSGQLVRRTLERATAVRASADRPATYRLR